MVPTGLTELILAANWCGSEFLSCDIMDTGFKFICQAEARRLLLIMVAAIALVVVIQYFEFPSTLFSVGNTSSFWYRGSSKDSEMLGNMALINSLNSTNTGVVNKTTKSSEAANVKKETFQGNESKEMEGSPESSYIPDSNRGSSNTSGLVSNGFTSDDYIGQRKSTSTLENGQISVNSYPSQKAMAPDTSFQYVSGDIDSVSGENRSSGTDFEFPPSASTPMNALFDTTFPEDKKLSSPMVSVNSNISSASKVGAGSSNIAESSKLLPSGYSKSKSPAIAKGKKSKKPPSRVISISQMNELLKQSRASSFSVSSKWPSEVDQEVLFAKSQIERASEVKNDTSLYAPIYRNVSMFRRSYELMESTLKVYIYQDGEKPIFHQPILEGIYASEGWFMKLMEANEKFVTRDPKKAHLFYFPFSSRLLELTLYVRKSHSRQNLIQYMKNYVEMMAAKYPFWNRTGGADHFLAACHDWAPAETRGAILNCIRALCNADIDVGFSIGKDVSLPETYVRSAQNPFKNLEGNPSSQRPILAFFAGNMHGYVRPILLEYWGNNDPDMKIFGPMPRSKGNTNYIQYMKSSKYCICPRGFEVNSPRIVEAIFYECVPVIISDNYVPLFFEVLDWESFAVFVLEKDISDLKNTLLSISNERYVEMHKRVKKVQQHFLWHTKPVKYDLFHMILHSVWCNRVFQIRSA